MFLRNEVLFGIVDFNWLEQTPFILSLVLGKVLRRAKKSSEIDKTGSSIKFYFSLLNFSVLHQSVKRIFGCSTLVVTYASHIQAMYKIRS